MELIRLNRKDGTILTVCLVLFLVSLWVGVNWFDKAFPEASIDFQTTRSSSQPLALEALATLDLVPPAEFRHASRFGYSNLAKIYLEKELGLDSAQQVFGDPVELWYWSHRWFKPSTKEEFKVDISPEGEVVGIDHLIDEDAQGASLPRDSASTLARDFLSQTMGVELATLELIEGSQTGRPNRTDWSFAWKLRDFEPVKGSDYRYEVTLLGDKIGGYQEYLHVPEAWTADYRRLRSLNDLASNVDGVFMLLTVVAIVAVFFVRIRRMEIHWRTAIWFGGIAALLTYLTNLNSLPQSLYFYDTTTSWSGFLLRELLLGLLAAFGAGVMIALLTASAEAIFRNRYPHLPALPRMFTVRSLRTKSAFINIVVGITMTAFFFAYQVLFYMASHRLGGWSPADVPYDNLLNTAFPWIAVLFIGFMPAVSEEFMSRMFSIPFLQNLFRNRFTWLAVLIPAFIWGFGHASYANEPFWIRGVEVGVAGVIVGFIMLRFGILAPLVWHYTVDALYTAFLLFRSDNPYFIVTASVASGLMVIPLLLALIAYWRKGGFLPEEGVRNSDIVLGTSSDSGEAAATTSEPVLPASDTPNTTSATAIVPLGALGRIVAVVLLAAGLLIARPERPGDYVTLALPADQAVSLVADSLRTGSWADPDTLILRAFPPVSYPDKASTDAYLLKQLGSVEHFNTLKSTLQPTTWRVNAWSPENRLRYSGHVNGSGQKQISLYLRLPEEMAGDSLAMDSARTLAETALRQAGVDLTGLVEKSVEESVRPHRKDYTFIYEAPEGDPRHVGEAKYRHVAQVNGSLVTASPRPYFYTPEEWRREREASTSIRTIRTILIVTAYALFIGFAITLLILRARKGEVHWKKAFIWAILPALLTLPGLPSMVRGLESQYFYSVELAWSVFLTSGIISLIIAEAMIYLLFALAFALLGTLYREKAPFLKPIQRRASLLDTLFAFVGGVGALFLFGHLTGWVGVMHPGWIPYSGPEVPDWLEAPWMMGAMLRESLTRAFLLITFGALLAYLWTGPLRSLLSRLMVVIGLLILFQDTAGVEPTEWLYSLISSGLLILLAWFVLRFLVQGNPVRFFALGWGLSVLLTVQPILGGLGNTSALWQGWLFCVLALLALLLWLAGVPGGGSRLAETTKG